MENSCFLTENAWFVVLVVTSPALVCLLAAGVLVTAFSLWKALRQPAIAREDRFLAGGSAAVTGVLAILFLTLGDYWQWWSALPGTASVVCLACWVHMVMRLPLQANEVNGE